MIYPLLAMVLLTLLVTLRLLFIGGYLVITKKVHIKQFRNMDGEFPKYALSARDQFRNMFEIPILFYLLCVLLLIENNYNQIDIYLAWGFVFFRLVHSLIRIPNRNVLYRYLSFIVSRFFLIGGWINFIIKI